MKTGNPPKILIVTLGVEDNKNTIVKAYIVKEVCSFVKVVKQGNQDPGILLGKSYDDVCKLL